MNECLDITKFIGKIFTAINVSYDQIEFVVSPEEIYIMYHEQDYSESVSVEDINGNITDLLWVPILKASEDTSRSPKTNTFGKGDDAISFDDDSATWTFYNLATIKGYVTIRWYGSSNGYYSESVDIKRKQNEDNG